MANEIRLQKYIADNGLASRRKAEAMIEAGKVKVNGRTAKIGDKVNPGKDLVSVDGQKLDSDSAKYYIMLHKPRGFVTTMSDEQGRKCVADLVSDIPARVYPIGRLDKDSEGIILMTNDGAFANMISHPSGHIPKLYRVTVKPAVTEDMLIKMSVGMLIDGKKTAPCSVRVITEEKGRVVLEIVLNEGRNRQIRKMCEALGLEVARLKRTAIGPVKLGMLQTGEYRELQPDEIRRLKAASQKAQKLDNTDRRRNSDDRDPSDGRQGQRKRTTGRNSAKRK